jgi:hypothetical protein
LFGHDEDTDDVVMRSRTVDAIAIAIVIVRIIIICTTGTSGTGITTGTCTTTQKVLVETDIPHIIKDWTTHHYQPVM